MASNGRRERRQRGKHGTKEACLSGAEGCQVGLVTKRGKREGGEARGPLVARRVGQGEGRFAWEYLLDEEMLLLVGT